MRDELIKLEDPEFEKRFVVYGNDPIEAKDILNAGLMARLVDFHDKARKKTGGRIYLSFTGSMVHVAIDCEENLFEPRIFGSNLDFGLIKDYFSCLELAFGIVDDLNI